MNFPRWFNFGIWKQYSMCPLSLKGQHCTCTQGWKDKHGFCFYTYLVFRASQILILTTSCRILTMIHRFLNLLDLTKNKISCEMFNPFERIITLLRLRTKRIKATFFEYCTSSNSFLKNYSFLNLQIIKRFKLLPQILISCLTNWIFALESREETIQGQKLLQ